MQFWKILRGILQGGLLRGWPGTRCPACRVRPGREHVYGCAVAAWDGGRWA